MLTALIFAGGLALGVSPIRLAMAWAAWDQPTASGTLLAALVVGSRLLTHRPSGQSEEATFLRTVAAELRAGRALRVALVEAAARSGLDLKETIRLALAGRPMPEVAHSLQRHLQDGRTVALAVKVASATGGRVSEVFDRLAVLAAEAEVMRRERRALSAQARLSSLIVGGFPLVYLLWQLLGGGWARLVASGPLGRASLVLGLVLLGLGAAAVALMLLRAER